MPSRSEIEAGRDEIARRLQELHKLHLAQRSLQMPHSQDSESQGQAQVLSRLAVTILGMEGTIPSTAPAAPQDSDTNAVAGAATARPVRKAQSYFNSFQTTCSPASDSPPSYASAAQRKPVSRRGNDGGREALPEYTCTVSAGVRMLVNMESVSPLHGVAQSEWRDIFVEVRGTLLNFYRVTKDGKPHRLLRSYTLQHAEIGLAPDAFHEVLVPNSKLAHLIPKAAQHKAYKKDPQLFRAEEQFIMRLRLETDQILLAHKSEDVILDLIHDIGAGIDLAPAIDERNISKQCTVPRRRRRPQAPANNDITNPEVIAEQERILQQMCPSFGEHGNEQNSNADASTTTATQQTAESTPLGTPVREEEEIDLSAIREDFNESNPLTPTTTSTSTRPPYSRTTTASSAVSTSQNVYETVPTNFSPDGKWQPPHVRTSTQVRRYVRRCAPLLMVDAVRASDIVICNGKRMRINWRAERLEDWRLQPPTYEAHEFDKEEDPTNSSSESEPAPAEQQPSTNTPSSIFSETSSSGSCAHDDAITPVDEQHASGGLTGLDLIKTTSTAGSAKDGKHAANTNTSPSTASRQKAREVQREDAGNVEAHGVMFCF